MIVMPNKSNTEKKQVKRSDRTADETVRKDRSSNRDFQTAAAGNGDEKNRSENVSRRGYYSRNGGYGGYRGL